MGQFKDYAPVLELVAERWEELETATGEFPVSRLSRWNDDPASFWRSLAPYLSRSSRLRTRFLEYCDDGSMVLQAPALLALARLVGPGSSLLLDCCKRVLAMEFDGQKWTPFDVAHATVVASKCLAAHFAEDVSAFAAIVAASDSLRGQGGAVVGLASRWPDHEIVVREYRNLLGSGPHGLLVCADLWLLSVQGTREQVATSLAKFVTRHAPSPWDFAEHALDAFRARLERDPEVEETLRQLAIDNDEPSVRVSTARLLASTSTRQSQDLAEELLAAERRRSGPPRFALDILTNRIRPVGNLMREVLVNPTVREG